MFHRSILAHHMWTRGERKNHKCEVYLLSAVIGYFEYLYQHLYCSCPLYQIDWVCEKLLADPLMADGYNAIGISQGGLLIRLQRKQ